MGSGPILSTKGAVTIDTVLNFDGHGHADDTCKQTLKPTITGVRWPDNKRHKKPKRIQKTRQCS